LLAIACSSASGHQPASLGETGGAGGSSGAADGSGGSAASPGDGSGGSLIIDAGPKDSALTDDSACATEHAQAETVPLNIFIVEDVSGSMVNLGHWPNVLAGL